MHMKAVHGGVKAKCEVCGKEFNRAPEMRRHVKTVHKSSVAATNLVKQQQLPREQRNFLWSQFHDPTMGESFVVNNPATNDLNASAISDHNPSITSYNETEPT